MNSPFQASPLGDSVRIWKSEFPRDVRHGSLGFDVGVEDVSGR